MFIIYDVYLICYILLLRVLDNVLFFSSCRWLYAQHRKETRDPDQITGDSEGQAEKELKNSASVTNYGTIES